MSPAQKYLRILFHVSCGFVAVLQRATWAIMKLWLLSSFWLPWLGPWLVAGADQQDPWARLLPLPRTTIHEDSASTELACIAPGSLDAALDGINTNDREVLTDPLSWIKRAIEQRPSKSAGRKAAATFKIKIAQAGAKLSSSTNEAYNLTVGAQGIEVAAATIYGARHALSTLLQLIVLQPTTTESACAVKSVALPLVTVQDQPRFAHRGIMVDTARHFLPPSDLKRTIDGMAFVKLNVLHWHIVDSNSFPFKPPSHPELGEKGSFGPEQRYDAQDVKELVNYARTRGVRVVVEVDTPGHFYSWGLGMPDLVMCNGHTFHTDAYCSGPPCGYLKVESESAVQVVRDVLDDLMALTDDDTFHVGCDEIKPTCYGGVEKTAQLFRDYAAKLETTVKAKGRTLIAWADAVLAYNATFDKGTTLLQTWNGDELGSTQVVQATARGYRVIDSTTAALYLDCGTGGYINGGRSWCDPYKTWQTVYLHEPTAGVTPEARHLVEGAEVAAWGEKTGDTNLDNKLWPRAAALAERLWSDVTVRDVVSAQQRIRRLRGPLRSLFGVASTPIMPQSCCDEVGPGASQCDSGYSTYFPANLPLCDQGPNMTDAYKGQLLSTVTGDTAVPPTAFTVCLSDIQKTSVKKADGGALPPMGGMERAALEIKLRMQGQHLPSSPAKACNADEVKQANHVALLIAPGYDDPARYLEFAIAPTGFASIAVVTNANGSTPAQRTPISCDAAISGGVLSWDVQLYTSATSTGEWTISLTLPLSFLMTHLGSPSPSEDGSLYYRANVLRVDVPQGETLAQYPPDAGWFPHNPKLTFSSWQPTWGYPPPASMYATKYFGAWRIGGDVWRQLEAATGRRDSSKSIRGSQETVAVEVPPT